MRRTKEEAEHTRQTILHSALELFSEQGVSATSLSEIATHAGVTRGAIYWHFKNKWDLFEAIWCQHSAPLEELGQAAQSDDERDPLGKLSQLLRLILLSVEQDEAFRRMFMICIRENAEPGAGDWPQRMQGLKEDLHWRRVRALENAISRGQLPGDLDPEMGSLMIKVMLEGVVQTWLQRADCFSLCERADQFVDSILAVLKHGARRR